MIPTLHRHLVRGFQAAFVFCLTLNLVHAGEITGRVLDSKSGGYLPGATVTLVATGETAVADSDGRFRFADVAAGEAVVRADYIGYAPQTATVSVPASGAVPLTVELSESVVQMEAFLVEGERAGRAKALQQKKTAGNIMDIISADSVGNLPDRNVAEALSRVAGLSVDFNSGEGQFVTIRGLEPNYNNVTFNGATVAPPGVNGRSGRATQLDIIAASQISQIEVVKSVTPDMDGTALGGSINIKTVSGFDRKERFIFGALEAGYNGDSKDDVLGADLTYGNTFNLGGDRRLGLALAASYSKRHALNDEIQTNWNRDVATGNFFMSTLELHPEDATRERLGLNLNLEYQPDTSGTQFYLRGIYNEFDTDKNTSEVIMESRRDPVFVTPTSVTFNRMRYEIRQFREEPRQRLVNLTPGFTKKFNQNTLEADLTYSWSRERLRINDSVQFRTGNVNVPALFALDFTDFLPTFDDKGSITSPSTVFPLRRFRDETSLVREVTYTPRIDFRHDFDNWFGGRSGYLKIGGKYTDRKRKVDDNSIRPTNGALTLDQLGARGPGDAGFFDGRYDSKISVLLQPAFAFLNANPGQFTIDNAESQANSSEDDFVIHEKIEALYGMASVKVAPKLTLLGGLRYEHTDASVVGLQARTVNDVFQGVFEERGDTSYDDYLGNVQFRYEPAPNLVVRGAFTRTLGRPAYEDSAPISSLEVESLLTPINPAFPNSGALEIGNPDLEPFRARNFDLSVEYFLKSGGILSVSGFHKRIKNPIFQFNETQFDQTVNGIGFETLGVTQTRNADTGTVKGVELNAQIPFSTFFGSGNFLNGFGLDVNATFIDSSVKVFDREADDLPFFRQPDEIYNLAFYYQLGRINARIAYNYQTESIRELGSNLTTDIWQDSRSFTDLKASYEITRNFTIYGIVKNLTNARNDEFIGDKNRVRRSQIFGADVRFGVRFNF